MTTVCVVEADGRIRHAGKAATDPAALAAVLHGLADPGARVGLEVGPLAPWLYFGLRERPGARRPAWRRGPSRRRASR